MAQGSDSPRPFTQQIHFSPPQRAALSGKEQREAIWATLVKPFQSLAKQIIINGGDGTGMYGTGVGGRSLLAQSQLMVVVKKSYRRLRESKLITFATNFNTNLFLSTADFPEPPVSQSDMTKSIKEYEDAAELSRSQRSDHNTGQVATTKEALLAKLDTQIDYVEKTATTPEQVRAVGLEPTALAAPKRRFRVSQPMRAPRIHRSRNRSSCSASPLSLPRPLRQ